MPYLDPAGRWISDDGAFFWDGAAWRPSRPATSAGPPRALIVLAVAGALLVLFGMIGAGVFAVGTFRSIAKPRPPIGAASVRCQPVEQLAVHYHAHLTMVDNGEIVTIPGGVGIEPLCYYWLHTHSPSGIIHVETPTSEGDRTFTLADFFSVWRQPIGRDQVGPATVHSGEELRTWIQPTFSDSPQLWNGSPAAVPLRNCAAITIEIGRALRPPPSFTWPQGYLCDPGSIA